MPVLLLEFSVRTKIYHAEYMIYRSKDVTEVPYFRQDGTIVCATQVRDGSSLGLESFCDLCKTICRRV